MTTDRHACGLSSFLPMSCRGRAEAFARRLQSRLQSLGRQPSDEPHDSEESWLTNSQHFPTNHQPATRLSSSSDSDVYFDFDVYFGSPGSPLEEATEDNLHVNRAQASTSATAVAASPGSDDSTYFDPEGFDFGKVPLAGDCNGHDADPGGAYYECSSTDPLEDNDCPCNEPGGSSSSLTPTHETLNTDPLEDSDCPCNEPGGSSSSLTPTHETLNTDPLEDSDCPCNEPGGSASSLTPTHETRNTDPLGVTDHAGLVHSCTRVRKPRVDYTKCNGIRHQYSAETHEGETNTPEAQVAHLTKSHEAEVEHSMGACETETETHEGTKEGCEVEVEHSTETHEREAESNEAETRIQEAEIVHSTETHEREVESNEAETRIQEAEIEHSTETHEREAESNEAETRIQEAEIVHSTETHELETETSHEAETTTHEANVEQSTESHDADTKTHERANTSVAEPPEVFRSTLSVSTHKLLVAVPDVEVTTAPAAPEAAPWPAREKSKLEADDTDYEDRPQRVRRCSSLKTGKTPPGTPGRKKIVRFADVLGLDLADVRTFLDEVPKVPTSAYEDLADADFSSSLTSLAAMIGGSLPKPDKILVPMFVQPGGCADFFDRVREQQVCLENAIVSDVMLATIAGTVRVRNLDFNKSVHIRYSTDAWKTFSDLQARYVQNSCDGFSDTFSFVLYAHTLTVGQRLEFAVRFQCHGCQYWDSNRGGNYVFQCLPPAGQTPFRSQPMSTCPDEQWASFY